MPAMVRLEREAGWNKLRAWWRIVYWWPLPQHIIHILRPFTPDEFEKGPAYQEWLKGGEAAKAKCFGILSKEANTMAYINDASRPSRWRVSNTRIFFASREDLKNPRSAQRYAEKILYPFIASRSGETIIMVFQEGYEAAGFPVRVTDVNIWGFPGIMRTGYANGDVAWREFLPWWRHPWQVFMEHRFVLRVARFARKSGVLIAAAESS